MDPTQLALRDLHLPEPVGWWPPAIGWWLLSLLVLAGLALLLVKIWRKRQANAPRRYALRELQALEAEYLATRDPVRLGKQLSQLLRRSMLAYAARSDVAGLTGDSWLAWLDQGLPVPYFHTDGGKSLLQLPYRKPDDDFGDVDIGALLAAVRMRLSTPLAGDN